MASKNKGTSLTALEIQSLPISISEARKLLGSDAINLDDNEVAQEVLLLNELAIFLTNNIDLHKMHL